MVRIQFEISSTLAKEMEDFELEADITSHREFYANLISLWRWAASRSKEGKLIAAIHPVRKTYNEITLPALETVKLKAMAEQELELAALARPQYSPVAVENENIAKSGDLTAQPA